MQQRQSYYRIWLSTISSELTLVDGSQKFRDENINDINLYKWEKYRGWGISA